MAFIVADRVKETSTSTGAGVFTLAGAVTGHKTFASRCAVGDRCYYCIQAVDAGGAPSGEWETGVGIYSAANTLTRQDVFESSASDAAVTFSAGAKQVFITIPANPLKWGGEALDSTTQVRDYYVRKDGSDANTGLLNTAGGAFLTIQKALDVAASIGLGYVMINVSAGTYDEYLSFPSYAANKGVYVMGDDPTTVTLNSSTGIAANLYPGQLISGFTLLSIGTYTLVIDGAGGGPATTVSNVIFGATGGGHILGTNRAVVYFGGPATVAASATAFLTLEGQSRADLESSLVMTGTPAFSKAFVALTEHSVLKIPGTEVQEVVITGSATGKRYDLRHNSVLLDLQALTLPGNSAGTTASGGQYANT